MIPVILWRQQSQRLCTCHPQQPTARQLRVRSGSEWRNPRGKASSSRNRVSKMTQIGIWMAHRSHYFLQTTSQIPAMVISTVHPWLQWFPVSKHRKRLRARATTQRLPMSQPHRGPISKARSQRRKGQREKRPRSQRTRVQGQKWILMADQLVSGQRPDVGYVVTES
jgi:hypothetical protein